MNADKRRLKRIGLSVFIGVNRRLKMPFSDFFSSLLGLAVEDADVVEVAVFFGVVQPVTHYKFVGDLEADVVDVDGPQAAFGLVEQGGDADGVGLALVEQMHEVVESDACIHNVFDNQDVGAFERNVEVLGDLDFTGAGSALAISGDAHEIEGDVALEGAGQIGEEKAGSLKNANELQLARGIIAGNLRAKLADPRLDLLGGDQDS